jgi:hypothetical protein
MEGCAERKRIGLGKGAASANAKGKLETLTPRLSPDPNLSPYPNPYHDRAKHSGRTHIHTRDLAP